MPTAEWSAKNRLRKIATRLRYPPPLYKKVGGINAVKLHADGTQENYGQVTATYAARWGVGSGQ